MPEATVKKVRRNIGLKDFYIAEVIKNNTTEYTTGTPVKLARAINAKITEKYNIEKIYSDDLVEDILESFESGEIEIEINKLSNSDVNRLYDTIYKDGYLCKSGSDVAKEVALGWRSKKADNTYDFEWLYCVKFNERPEREYSTKNEKVDAKTNTLKGTFYEREKEDIIDSKHRNLYSIAVDEAELVAENKSALEAIKNWFSKVQEYTAPAA